LNPSFLPALEAAHSVCQHQDYPVACLYLVATPIGNLADISLRALHVLDLVDVIACEDTRHTGQLLRAYGLASKGASNLVALHQHNETSAAQDIINRLSAGERVAYVSDAGTPAVSDPGAKLVHWVRQAGFRVMPLPGASSVITALSAAGVIQDGGFLFEGFLPSSSKQRQNRLEQLASSKYPVIFLEAPHRIQALADDLAIFEQRPVTAARELTKQFEEIITLAANAWAQRLKTEPQSARGEFVVILHPATTSSSEEVLDTKVLELLLKELPLKTAVKLCVEITGQNKNEIYEKALMLKNQNSAD
jgi:16S rRNA (cytidine1402-2'-O)-methyltransferase